MVTKSEIRRLEHQGTKYENNEAYEKGKARLMNLLEKHINDTYSIDSLDVLEVLRLLNQSKWIGDNNQQVKYDGYFKPFTLLKDEKVTTIPS